ncbi:MAG TPA: hypothetical protein DEF34_08005 [Desulfotomaculum sp.]|nr:MAG: hypothetical protein VR67_05030 [Peptococcaceae bacterium BRH_c8a]KJS72852.1 MAG: hypothetical protein JL56_11890 [Desulfotomaculum sp. BICA1-6]HBX23556.1 hypothetical protein [Desulfotomaculum sp.]
MMERDRLTRGFYAGLGATVLQNVWSFLAYAVGLTTLRMADWSAIIIFGRGGPFSTAETLFGLLGHLVWGGFLGIVFVYLIPHVKHRHLTLKGLLYGWSIWFFIYSLTLLFSVEPTLNLPLLTPISDFIGATIYGLVLAWVVNSLTEKEPSI